MKDAASCHSNADNVSIDNFCYAIRDINQFFLLFIMFLF